MTSRSKRAIARSLSKIGAVVPRSHGVALRVTPVNSLRQDASPRIPQGRETDEKLHVNGVGPPLHGPLRHVLFCLEIRHFSPRSICLRNRRPPLWCRVGQMTRTRGVATIAVYTPPQSSQNRSGSGTVSINGTWARINRGLVQLVNVSTDDRARSREDAGNHHDSPPWWSTSGRARGVSHLGHDRGFRYRRGFGESTPGRSISGLNTGSKERSGRQARPGSGGDIYPSQQYAPPAPSWPQVQLLRLSLAQPPASTDFDAESSRSADRSQRVRPTCSRSPVRISCFSRPRRRFSWRRRNPRLLMCLRS